MRLFGLRWPVLLCILLCLVACGNLQSNETEDVTRRSTPTSIPVSLDDIEVVTGQIIYVPAYSEIYYTDPQRTLNLTITLAVHNTDLNNPIILRSVRYYNNDGQLVREYVPEAIELSAFATRTFVVEIRDRTGGVGANFIVEWVAETRVSAPAVEAVMISAQGQQGLSFVSPGRVLSEID